MRLFFILLFCLALFGLLCGGVALFGRPNYALTFLVPSSIYISAFLLAYTFEESQKPQKEHRRKERESSRSRNSRYDERSGTTDED